MDAAILTVLLGRLIKSSLYIEVQGKLQVKLQSLLV